MAGQRLRPEFSWKLRFNPHVLVFFAMLLAAIPPLKGSIIAFVHWWYDASYTKAIFVMDEGRPNEGAPYIAGHLEGSTEQRNLVGASRGTDIVVRALPDEVFAAGKRIEVWHSEMAPNMVVFGDEVNTLPVAALPERPGLVSLLLHLAWLLATAIVGLNLMGWVAARWSRRYYGHETVG